MIYHYDYRGSVIKVTDIDGNITDTLKYDAYGSVIERAGTSKLIFTYNGQYGVLTDPNALLYMRTRFYNSQLKRFMNAELDGSIADSTTLNLYAYVNGNPISFVDPFGMEAKRGQNSDTSSGGIVDWIRKYITNPFMLGGYEELKKFVALNGGLLNTAFVGLVDQTSIGVEFIHNWQYDIVGNSPSDIRNDQNDSNGPLANLRYGTNNMTENGCEIIAVYNALLLLGYEDVSMATLILQHQLIGADVLGGLFGTQPKKTGEILDSYDVEYETLQGIDEIDKNGVYIISYWTGNELKNSLHTVAVDHFDSTYKTYNTRYGKRTDSNGNIYYSYTDMLPENYVENRFVYGYYLGDRNNRY